MAASDHLHPEQMKLFMRPDEIKGAVTDSPDRESTMAHMWKYKEAESRQSGWLGWGGAGLHKELTTNTVNDPVTLHTTPGVSQRHMLTMGEGHHRVAAAHAVERETKRRKSPRTHWIPVQYQEGH
jgi:hypothetical protein